MKRVLILGATGMLGSACLKVFDNDKSVDVLGTSRKSRDKFLHLDAKNNNLFVSPFFIILLLWYPCFELLFTISRRVLKKKSSFFPDNLHLHYLLASFFKNRFNLKKKNSDIFTSLSVGIYNYFIFYYSINFISRTKNLITIILINILLYSFIYIILKNLKMRRKVF
jgi:Na+/melibiose symporter-like transporter